MYVYPFDVSMSGLLVLAEYAGQVNELTVDGLEDVMARNVITATQIYILASRSFSSVTPP